MSIADSVQQDLGGALVLCLVVLGVLPRGTLEVQRGTVPGPLGEMRVSLTYSDPTISGTWAALDLTGQIRGTRMAQRKPDPNSYPKYFRLIYESVRDTLSRRVQDVTH